MEFSELRTGSILMLFHAAMPGQMTVMHGGASLFSFLASSGRSSRRNTGPIFDFAVHSPHVVILHGDS